MKELKEPKGIGFYSIKSDETHYAKLEPQIQAYINSSDMGINASRGQDFGWRLDPTWVKRVKAFRRDATQMSILSANHGGQKPTTVQILYYLYGEELRAYEEAMDENENPYEGKYQRDIADEPQEQATTGSPEQPTTAPPLADIPETISESDLEPGEEVDTDGGAEVATSETPVSQERENAILSPAANNATGFAEPRQEEPSLDSGDQPLNQA